MPGMTLADIREMVKAELMQSLSATHHPAFDDNIDAKVRGQQIDLSLAHYWPDLVARMEVPLPAAREVSIAGPLEVGDIIRAYLRLDGCTHELQYGIPPQLYDMHDSTAGEAGRRVRAWLYRHTASGVKIEVWPIPGTADEQTLVLDHRRPLGALSADSDVSDLDGRLLALATAASIADARGAKDAPSLAQAAARRLAGLLNDHSPRRAFLRAPALRSSPYAVPRIRVE